MTVRSAGAVQEVPWDTVNILTPFFGRGPDPVAARLLALPALRGAWVGSVASGGTWHDISGHGNHLAYNGDPQHDYYRLVPYWDLDGAGDYFNITDAASGNDFDVLGTEGYVAVAVRGLTLGGWFYADVDQTQGLMTKGDTNAANSAYELYLVAGGTAVFRVSNGAAYSTTTITVPASGAWLFLAGRYRVSVPDVTIFYDGQSVTVAGPAAPLNNSANDLMIGGFDGGAPPVFPLDGRASCCSLCAAALSDTIINSLYHQTKELFGH